MGAYKSSHPEAGLSYMIGFLRVNGLRIQRKRVGLSLRRVDGLGQILRANNPIDRQKYSVPHSNYLWHLDGHHKLIKYGIVIHGFVDGHDHTVSLLYLSLPSYLTELMCRCQVPGIEASTNNRADTVLVLFKKAIKEFGVPSRMRGDKGGENIEVSVWMVKYRGVGRASFMWGS